MKTSLIITFCAVSILLLTNSCSIEKRLYNAGYNIQWNKKISGKKETAEIQTQTSGIDETERVDQDNLARIHKVEKEEFANNSDEENLPATDNSITDQLEDVKQINVNKEREHTVKEEFKKGTKALMDDVKTQKTHGLAIAGLLSGIAGLFIFGIIFGILALIFSSVALNKIRNDQSRWKGKGLAIAGLVLAIVDILAWVVFMVVI